VGGGGEISLFKCHLSKKVVKKLRKITKVLKSQNCHTKKEKEKTMVIVGPQNVLSLFKTKKK
jgi:hypothetical protein